MGKKALSSIIETTLIICILVTVFLWYSPSSTVVMASPAYEYFGYAPPSNFSGLDADPGAAPTFRYGWEMNATTNTYVKNYGWVDNGTCYLDFIGYNDSTNVQVYDITRAQPILRESFSVNRMKLHNTTIPAKTYFKVVSDKPLAVMVGGGQNYGSGFNLFYPSTDGGFVGKEFIFMSIYGRGRMERPAPGATIHALEDAKVTVYDDKGGIVLEREMKANTTKTVTLLHRYIHRVASTGRILVGTWSQYTVKAIPAVNGGFIGTYFIVYQDYCPGYAAQLASIFFINQDKASHVKMIDMANGQTMIEKDISPRGYWFLVSKELDFSNKPVMISSTGELIIIASTCYSMNPIPTNLDSDVTMIGVRANEPTSLYVVSKAVAFSPKATARVSVGAATITIPQGRYAELPTGLITVSTNSTLIVEMISQPTTTYPAVTGYGGTATQVEPEPLNPVALDSWGTYLLTAEGAELTYTPPKKETEMDITLYATIGAVAVIAVAVVVVFMRRGRKK